MCSLHKQEVVVKTKIPPNPAGEWSAPTGLTAMTPSSRQKHRTMEEGVESTRERTVPKDLPGTPGTSGQLGTQVGHMPRRRVKEGQGELYPDIMYSYKQELHVPLIKDKES